jgi:ketosteroid isomerase-like protein
VKRLAVIALVLTACGGGSKPKVEKPEAVDPEVAVREARDLIEEAYASLRRGDAEGLLPLLAPNVFIVGPGAGDVLPHGSDTLVALGDYLDDSKVKKHKLKSRDLQVVASTGGHSVWATDHLELDGATYAMTAVLTHEDDLWTFRAVHVSRTWKSKQLDKREPVPGMAFPPPEGDVPDAKEQVVPEAEAAITDLQDRLDQLPDVEADEAFDVVVVGTAPRGATHGV